MKPNFIPVLMISGVLSACTTLSGHYVPEEYKELPENAAFLAGSISVKTAGSGKSWNNHSKIFFRRKGAAPFGHIQISDDFLFPSEFDYESPNSSGSLFLFPLKAGEYELVNVEFYYNNGQFEKVVSAREDFSVPFRLEAGKAYYVGEFLAFGRWGKNIFGIPIVNGGYFRTYDKRDRDVPLLRQKHPELRDLELVQLDLKPNVPPFLYTGPE